MIELGESGRAIWSAFAADKLDAPSRALVLEFARCADTCDHLDGLAAGRKASWVELTFDDMGEIHLEIDRILELRLKHQTTLKALFAEIRAAKIEATVVAKVDEPEDMLEALRNKKEQRERQSG